MKEKNAFVLLFASSLVLSGCTFASSEATSVASSSNAGTSTTSVGETSSSGSSIPAGYGDFSIVKTANGAEPSYDESTKTYTLAVASSKSVYTLSGYFEGSILVSNPDNLASYKSVELVLNHVYLRQTEIKGVGISYTLDEKYLELNAASGTTNYIVSEGSAVVSKNNLRLGGDGILNLQSNSAFGAKGDDIGLYGPLVLNVTSGSDGLHGKNLYTNNLESGTSLVNYTGTCSLVSGASEQALDFCDGSGTSEDPWTGSIEVNPQASFVISGAGNVARCNSEFVIEGSVIATNIIGSPIITKVEGTLIVTVTGTFKVNGEDIHSETL